MSLTFYDSPNAIPVAKDITKNKIIYLLPLSTVYKPIPQRDKVYQTEYRCPYCKTEYKTEYSLKRHLSKYCKERPDNMPVKCKIEINGMYGLVKLPQEREIIMISGPPKAGKTYFTNEYAKMAKTIYNKNIVLFTCHKSDETMNKDESQYNRIVIGEQILKDKYTLEDLKDTLCIFDDIESSSFPKVTTYLYELLNDIIKNGRHHNISVIFTNQMGQMGQRTKNILQLMSELVIFPMSGSVHSMKYVLAEYIGCSKQQINKILNLKSRWVAISREAPQYVCYERGIYLLNADIY
jgi:hypothetical protein